METGKVRKTTQFDFDKALEFVNLRPNINTGSDFLNNLSKKTLSYENFQELIVTDDSTIKSSPVKIPRKKAIKKLKKNSKKKSN